MSTDLRIVNKHISLDELFDGRLERFGITEEHVSGETDANARCLTDGTNFLWAYRSAGGKDVFFTFWGLPRIFGIVNAIEDAFDAEIYTEHEPKYWGFDTDEEWETAEREAAKKHDDEFYDDLMKYVKGQPNAIEPGTNGETMAVIAKELIGQSPSLARLEAKDELMSLVKSRWEGDHLVRIRLPDDVLATIQTHAATDINLEERVRRVQRRGGW